LLLKANIELKKSNLVLRTIQPSSTFFSKEFDQVMFADLSASCQYKSKQTREVGTSRPYSSIDFFEFKDEHNSSGFWDRWSIGIMILEIIIGTDLLLDQTTFS
jgi:hypothetical protein